MPRKRKASGIGRGNGEGSRSTQFKNGQPSANPKGRPRKPRQAPSSSLLQAVLRKMAEPVAVFDGSRSKRMPRFDALAELMVRRLSDAEFHQQLAFMRELNRMREYSQPEQYQPSQETIEDVLAQLSAEADREA